MSYNSCTDDTGLASGVLAYGTSSGAVGSLEITQRLVEKADPSLFAPEYDIEVTVEDLGLIYQPDMAGITSMQWIAFPTRPVSIQKFNVRYKAIY